jgi:hypothetical protein
MWKALSSQTFQAPPGSMTGSTRSWRSVSREMRPIAVHLHIYSGLGNAATRLPFGIFIIVHVGAVPFRIGKVSGKPLLDAWGDRPSEPKEDRS